MEQRSQRHFGHRSEENIPMSIIGIESWPFTPQPVTLLTTAIFQMTKTFTIQNYMKLLNITCNITTPLTEYEELKFEIYTLQSNMTADWTDMLTRMKMKFHHLHFTCCLPFPENNTNTLDGFLWYVRRFKVLKFPQNCPGENIKNKNVTEHIHMQ